MFTAHEWRDFSKIYALHWVSLYVGLHSIVTICYATYMQPKHQGFATALVILCIAVLSVASGVYLYKINSVETRDAIVTTTQQDATMTEAVSDAVATSTTNAKDVVDTVIPKKEVTKVTAPKSTRVVLGLGDSSPEYSLTLASQALLSWQFGRDYVDITVQIDNHCTGRSCPTPPINFIARDLKNTGSHGWLVGDWMIAANGYVHGIMPPISYLITARDSVTKEVLGKAKLSLTSGDYSANYVTVNTPNAWGTKLARGASYNIRWTTWPLKSFAKVNISIINHVDCPPSAPASNEEMSQPTQFPIDGCVGTGKTYVIAKDIPNTGTYTWMVGKSVSGETIPHGNYRVIVEVPGQAYDKSHTSFELL